MNKKIDTFSTLVMSVFSKKGVYALLLGSGISLQAKIMSGWKVTEDLIKKLALIQGEAWHTDAFEWFEQKYGCKAEYSKLLEQLGKKPSEMESLLRPYFESSEEDKEFGYKKPTDAHKAIADMAKRGYFKVIITTNFDRLMESALDEIGVAYQVICHESEITSRVPIYHHPLTLLKINGDYKDCRFRNTEEELSNYPQELISYLDAILKNFGLITCGWSATWDKALIQQLISNRNHRYSYFYTYLGNKSNEIEKLETESQGESLQIDGADNFFTEINERIKALEMINGKNLEVDAEVAIARIKTYISDLKKLIQYTDLYENITDRLLKDTREMVYGPEYPNAAFFEKAIAENANALSTLLPMSVVAVRWAEKEHHDAIVGSLFRIANRPIKVPSQCYDNTVKLNHLLDTIYLYGLGIACLYYEKYGLFDKLLKVKFLEHDHYFSPYIIDQDNCWIADKETWNSTTGYNRLKTPFSTTLGRVLRPYFSMIQKDEQFFSYFCLFEKLLAMYYHWLICKALQIAMWPPMGMFCWQPAYLERSHKMVYSEFFESVAGEQENSKVFKSGMFDGRYDLFKESYNAVTETEKKALAGMY